MKDEAKQAILLMEQVERVEKLLNAIDEDSAHSTICDLATDIDVDVLITAAAASRWRSIEREGLPTEDGGYLTTYPSGDKLQVSELFLETDVDDPAIRRWAAGGDGWPNDFPVIAWAELPAPYTGEYAEERQDES